VQARLGAPVVIETKEITWQEEEVQTAVRRQLSVVSRFPSATAQASSPPQALAGITTDNGLRTTDIRLSGELTLRDADSLRLPTSWQQFNPVEVVGTSDEGARVRTVRVRAATPQDLAPLQSYFGSGHLLVKVIRREKP
jgi:hypothetical protein